MKKYLVFFAIAFAGGLAALGLSKVFTKSSSPEFGLKQPAIFTNLPNGGTDLTSVNFVKAAELATPAVVHIKVSSEGSPSGSSQNYEEFDPFEWFKGKGFQLPQPGPSQGSGSGVIISQDGYIVTNNHVVDKAEKIEVILNDKKSYLAEVIGADPNFDLALIKIDTKGLPFLSYGNSDEVKVGEWVLAVGNPFNLTSTVTAGIVSAKARNIRLLNGSSTVEAFLQTDAAVNPGNSGGALVNLNGDLVGINTAIASETGSYAGYSFAVPVNLVKKVVEDLYKYGKVQRGFLGIQIRDVDAKLAEEKGFDEIKGVFVDKVNENSAAADAGIKAGDVIYKVDETVINSVSELQEQISRKKPGDKVVITYSRDNKIKTADVILKNENGKTTIESVAEVKAETGKALGAEFTSIDKQTKTKYKIQNGVKVAKVGAGKIKNAGILEGFIITHIDKKPIYTVGDVTSAFVNKKGGIMIEGINPDGSKGYYAFGVE